MPTSVEQSLFARFYAGDDASSGMSSHWREFSSRFSATVGEDGRLELSGYGFGDCRWQNARHRLFDTLTRWTHLRHLPHRAALDDRYQSAARVVRAMSLDPTFDVFRQVCTADLIVRALGSHVPSRILMVGDGYGVLGTLLKIQYPKAQVVFVDLGKTLLFQAHHVGRALPHVQQSLIAPSTETWPETGVVFCPADHAARIGDVAADVAINVASMQEMTPDTIAAYFAVLRRSLGTSGLFYCCNRERKVLPGGEVAEFLAYPWRETDDILLDEPCPWHQYYLAPRGFGWWGSVPVPFLQRYDGVHRHRLVRFA